MNNTNLELIVNDYIKETYPIKKYRIGRRFIKGVRRENKIYSLKANDEKKKLYYLISDDLIKVLGTIEEHSDLILLRYLKFF